MKELTMCGYCCELCKAYATNIQKKDQRKKQLQMWDDCYGGFDDCSIDSIYCEGCRCDKPDVIRIDSECPVRKCVIEKELLHCGDCNEYPCETFGQREGICFEKAKEILKDKFDANKYEEYLRAFDNKTNLDNYRKEKPHSL